MKQFIFTSLLFVSIIGFSKSTLKHQKVNVTNKYSKDKDSLFKKKLKQLKKQDDLEEYLYAYFDYFVSKGNSKKIEILLKGEQNKWREPKTNDEKIALLHLKINIGYHYLKKGNISESVIAYENALYYYKKNKVKQYDIIEYCLKPLANNYTRLGDYNRADDVLKYTLQLVKTNKKQRIATYINLSIKYQSIHKNKEAIEILENALQIKPITTLQKQSILSQIGKNYYMLSDYKKALQYLEESDTQIKQRYSISQNNITKGLCFLKQEKYDKAENHLKKGLQFANKNYKNDGRRIAKIYNLLANVNVLKHNFNEAQNYYQKSLQKLLLSYHPKTIYEYPLQEQIYAENSIMEALDGRASIFAQQKDYVNAIKNYYLAFKVGELLQDNYTSQQSKIIQQTEKRNRTEKVVEIYYDLYQESNEIKYIEAAFKITEKSKASVLSDILKAKFLRRSLKTDILFIKEQSLLKEKAILDKNIILEKWKGKNADLEKIKKLISKKTIQTTNLKKLRQTIEKKYPSLATPITAVSIKKIQKKLLQKNQMLIEFFDTKKYIYVFSTHKNSTIRWRRVVKDASYHTELRNYLSLFRENGRKLKNDITIYQKSAYYLYKQLIQPEIENNEVKNISLIPDGKLNFVPFDALLTKSITHTNFKKMPYLLFKSSINYGYSATILLQHKTKNVKASSQQVLGFFPIFENNYRKQQELSYTIEEQKNLVHYNKGLYLKGSNATKKAFLKYANDYDIIHLSTHASAGTFLNPAQIEFRNEALFLPEIYGLHFQADLLVLSACETGLGKFQKGEGVMSLARGFSYAGVQNLLVSLWKVNDRATSKIMRNFYKNYKKSSIKYKALHQAKLDYLNDENISNNNKTPYYWASFVFIGNAEIDTISELTMIYGLGFFVLILLILYFSRKYFFNASFLM